MNQDRFRKQRGKLQNQTLKSVVYKKAEADQKIVKSGKNDAEDGKETLKLASYRMDDISSVKHSMASKSHTMSINFEKMSEAFAQIRRENKVETGRLKKHYGRLKIEDQILDRETTDLFIALETRIDATEKDVRKKRSTW